jgi:hypothetical protein
MGMINSVDLIYLGPIARKKFDIGCKIIETYYGSVRYCIVEEFKSLLYNAIKQCHTSTYSLIIREAYTTIGNEDEKEIVDEIIQKLLNLKV